jgi:hypothetical protein
MLRKYFLLFGSLSVLAAVPSAFAAEPLELSNLPSIGEVSPTSEDLFSPTPTSPDASPSPAVEHANYMDAAPSGPNIHGFAGVKLLTDYITPRGLVVLDKGLITQPIVGLVFPLGDLGPLKNFTFVGGIWNCLGSDQGDAHVGPWNEMDDFFSLSTTPIKNLNFNFTYVAFNSPTGAYVTEHNIDLMTSYNDSGIWGGNFGLHPYLDIWYAISGSSTVINGRAGNTGYLQPGITPTYTVKAIANYPITLTLPTYLSFGPAEYWSVGGAPRGGTWGSGNIGLFCIGFDASMPMSFIPIQYGNWSLDAGVTYFDLVSNALLNAGTLASGNTRRDLFMGEVGLTVKF